MSPRQRVLRRLKWLLALALDRAGALGWLRARRARRGEIPVLLFHRLGGTAAAPEPRAVPVAAFAELVAALSRRYAVGSWQACVRAAARPAARPHVAVTFDDGYRDAATDAWPILRAAGAAGIFFVPTAFVDTGAPLWPDLVAAHDRRVGDGFPVNDAGEATFGARAEREVARLKTLPAAEVDGHVRDLAAGDPPSGAATLAPPLTWEQARRMAAEGADFGAHGRRHAILTRCTDTELRAELDDSRAVLARRLERSIDLFAYPNGSHDARVADATARAGFRWAFTTEPGWYSVRSDPLRVPRLPVSQPTYSPDGVGFSWALFEAEMLGVFDVLLLRRLRRRLRRGDAPPRTSGAGGDGTPAEPPHRVARP